MMTKSATSTDSVGLFSAPRKFDILTILVVTTAYAAVFALLRAINFSGIAVLIVAAFFTSVALGQAILFGAKHPRWASALVGSLFFVVMIIGNLLIDQQSPRPDLLLGMIWSILIFGAFAGYIGGVFVGFVFMVAHGIRLALSPSDSRVDLMDE
jgi:hypothetical protein